MTTQPPDVVPTVEERPKRNEEEARADDENMVACLWCARKSTAHEWLRRRMLEKSTVRALSRGPKEAQDAPVSDGGTAKKKRERRKFACQTCHGVLKGKAWLKRHAF
ncbi:hypothetical protein ERJ75_000847300 [Trypanosoma vivax]|nr:hypothetical protein ERJ75_000847300 [Trypanosoma vivax]